MTDNTIVIDLSGSNHNRPVSKGSELIQRQAFDSLRKKLDEDIKLASGATHFDASNDYDEEGYPSGSGLTYFIDGTRGAGKSTFLRFALQQLANPERVGRAVGAFRGEVLHGLHRGTVVGAAQDADVHVRGRP